MLGVIVGIYISLRFLVTLPMARKSNSKIYSTLFAYGLGTFSFGGVLWVTEYAFCKQLEWMHLHVIWHILAGYGSALLVLSTVVNSLDSLGLVVEEFHYKYGIIPVISFSF